MQVKHLYDTIDVRLAIQALHSAQTISGYFVVRCEFLFPPRPSKKSTRNLESQYPSSAEYSVKPQESIVTADPPKAVKIFLVIIRRFAIAAPTSPPLLIPQTQKPRNRIRRSPLSRVRRGIGKPLTTPGKTVGGAGATSGEGKHVKR